MSDNPKYKIIREELLTGISSGVYKDALPSENKLAKTYNVSRMTARKALGELVRDNYAERIHGKGTFVKKMKYTQGFFRVLPFRDFAESLNVNPGIKVLESGVVTAPPEISEKLGTERVIIVRRLHFFNEDPVRYEKRFLRLDLCENILRENLEEESINELLIKKFNLPLTKVWQRLTVAGLSDETAALFSKKRENRPFTLQEPPIHMKTRLPLSNISCAVISMHLKTHFNHSRKKSRYK